MIDALQFWGGIVAGLLLFGWMFWATWDGRRRRRELVDEIKARPSTVVWITEDGRIHTKYSLTDTEDVLEQAVEAVRKDMANSAPCANRRPGSGTAGEGGEQMENLYEQIARFLFGLLDDIDTVSDMAKDDDGAYRRAVTEIQQRRFEVADTDGQTVTFKVPELRPFDDSWRSDR
jgi:hypothetical protein